MVAAPWVTHSIWHPHRLDVKRLNNGQAIVTAGCEYYQGYSEHPLSVYSGWSEAIGTSGPRFSLWPTRERWAITVWIGAQLDDAAASPTRLSGVQQPLRAPGNRCSPIRAEDVMLCVSVLSKCVLSYCKYGVCSYISSCFPQSLPTCVNRLKATMSSWRPL